MIKLINAYKKNDPSAHSFWEILLLYPGIKAIGLHRIAHFFYQHKIPFLPRMIAEIARWLTGIEIHPGAILGHEIIFDHGMGVVIGETAVIGNRVLIYQGVTLGGTKLTKNKRHPTIGDDVILGGGCKILGDLIIGNNVRIGANAVVLTNIPADHTAAGVPARILQKNSPELTQWELDYQI